MTQRRRVGMLLAITGLTAGAMMATTGAHAAPSSSAAAPTAAAQGFSGELKTMAVESVMTSLGLSRAEAVNRIEQQPAQLALADRLTTELQSRAAGSFIDPDSGDLVVNVVDQKTADKVREAGAVPRIMTRTPAQLDAVRTELSQTGLPEGTAIGTDIKTDQVVISAPAGDPATAKFVAAARQFGDAVRVDAVSGRLDTQLLVGGDQIDGPGFICSAGFIASRGGSDRIIITAGHCTEGFPTFTRNGSVIGPTILNVFPGSDYGAVRINNPAFWDAQGSIRNGGGFTNITGSANPVVGSFACKSGRTTGTTCGTITQNNATVNFGGGDTVSGMTISNMCTQPGDSGGGMFTGGTARGIVSGGTVGGCTSSSISIFNPVPEALNAAGAFVV